MKNFEVYFSLILPAYNEVNTIGNTILEAVDYFTSCNYPYEIIVSADGNDGTRELVNEMRSSNPNLLAIGHEERSGKGRGIREAVAIARGKFIGFTDADNKTPISELDKVIPYLENGSDIVIGSRAQQESVIEHPQPLFRQIGSKGFRVLMHCITGLWNIRDTQCGFKFFQSSAAHTLFSHQKIDGYMYDVEILYLAKKLNYKIEQVPIRWRDDGDSRLQLVSGNIQNVLDLFRIRFGTTIKK